MRSVLAGLRRLVVPWGARGNTPRVVMGTGDPALQVLSQPAGHVWYWRDRKAFVMSVEPSGPNNGQLHCYVVENGALAGLVYDINFEEVTNTTQWVFAADVQFGGDVTLGSSTTKSDEENTLQMIAASASAFSPSGGASPAVCGVDFVAPASTAVTVAWAAEQNNSGAAFNLTSFEIRTGGVIGAGAIVVAANADRTVRSDGTSVVRAGADAHIFGLTPNAPYNIQLMHRTNGGTQTVTRRSVIVSPAL